MFSLSIMLTFSKSDFPWKNLILIPDLIPDHYNTSQRNTWEKHENVLIDSYICYVETLTGIEGGA
jgi:hypothetical protein